MQMKPLVLFAEDDENDALLCQRAFERSSLDVELRHVCDGACAIGWLEGIADYGDRVKFPHPSLIITDSKMPFKGGLDVLKWVHDHAAFRHIPVVLHYGSLFVQDLGVFDKLGVAACIEKRSNHSELLKVVAQVLRNPSMKLKSDDVILNAFLQTSVAA